jgi:hypothetical protein
VHEDSVEVQESKNPSRISKEKKAQEGQRSHMHSENSQSMEFTEDKEAKVEAFERPWKFFQGRKKAQKLKRSSVSRQIDRRIDLDHWF